ncbi:MAG: hypothetical protein FWE82_07560, partial [Defluviitaleaceae bacterium]|nr:hypothetical protein [Defluviitaleaceae bacterium]
AEKQKIPVTDALRLFMTTKTYELLTNPKSYLYLEAAPYVEDMLIAELSGDWESWMEAKKWKCGNLMMSYIFKQALRENICGGTI